MAYGSYFPQSYYQTPQFFPGNSQMPQNASQLPPNAQQVAGGGIIWVQGESAAKAYPVASGQSVFLMDSEQSVFYIKSTDQSGMPQPLRIFDYTERSTQHSNSAVAKPTDDYVSRREFEEFRDDVKRSIKDIKKPHMEESEGEG